jgi:murein DD-endopeptidase MepM/ murein hydrolase activator NlpD
MDRKIRIYFFPRDASRVRAIVFSRRVGITALIAALPLCLLGFWLVFTGELRESPERRFERDKLERETTALNEKTALLQHEIEALRRNLDSLESIRIRVALSSGLEPQRMEDKAGASPVNPEARYTGLSARGSRSGDFSAPLAKVRGISHFMDSTLIVLAREASLAARLPTASPVAPEAIVTRDFGPARDPFTGRKALHPGVDFGLPPGAPVHAAGGGTVVGAGLDPVWGHYVRIRHTERAETFYAHLLKPGVKPGQEIARGQIIGWVGQSGASTGPHLHFEMRLWGERVDPMPYILPATATL